MKYLIGTQQFLCTLEKGLCIECHDCATKFEGRYVLRIDPTWGDVEILCLDCAQVTE